MVWGGDFFVWLGFGGAGGGFVCFLNCASKWAVVAAGYETGQIKGNSLVKVTARRTCCVWVTGGRH